MEAFKEVLLGFAFEDPIKRVCMLYTLISLNRAFHGDIMRRCVRLAYKNEHMEKYFDNKDMSNLKEHITFIRYMSYKYVSPVFSGMYREYHSYFVDACDMFYLERIVKFSSDIPDSIPHIKENNKLILLNYISFQTKCAVCGAGIGVVDKSYVLGNTLHEYDPKCAYGCCIRCECGFDNINIKLIKKGSGWYEHRLYSWRYKFVCAKCGKKNTNITIDDGWGVY